MSAMTEQEIFKKVAEIIAEITESDKEINIDDHLAEDIGLVSIGYVELVVELEEAFDIIFPDNLLTDNNLITVRDVIDNVKVML